ncbi:DUF5701 family protein [Rhodococcus sp. IEGM 1379]|uniref:DUF5701 family protein n=1 Tax=Rhodococcus sp. IEGM 1379 TaxID=3047086 RepID=UPI0024B7EEF4|nr:DUF5701 family protein [Rhodococcus sp. IEGM 1379]MDI9916607.1 DUF5701 family protein [Rhodococcus sp. IEGM 1379]
MPSTLPPLDQQSKRLIELGVHQLAGLPAEALRVAATQAHTPGALLTIHEKYAPASVLAPLLSLHGKQGFIVTDMTDVDQFLPTEHSALPDNSLHFLEGVDRGDDMANWSPDEALPAMIEAQRTPLTLTEGIHWLLQCPDALERSKCFMTIGSRLRKPNGALDSRTPALWISNGTGRDGRDNKNAPKVGWCWAGNRHTWLGFASASNRTPLG